MSAKGGITMNLRERVRRWLGIPEYDSRINVLEKQFAWLKSLIHVGMDFHFKGTGSWAVICVEGKPEYVNFVKLDTKDVREISQFLSHFDRNNVSLDLPHGIPRELFF
jgi:hypothetical protein